MEQVFDDLNRWLSALIGNDPFMEFAIIFPAGGFFRDRGPAVAAAKRVIFGDLEDPDILEHLPLEKATWVLNTIPDRDLSKRLMKDLREQATRAA